MALNFVPILPESVYASIDAFISEESNMLDWFIASLITGSILSMPRAYLSRALPFYVPTVIGAVIVAGICAFIVGTLIGLGGEQSVMTVMIPAMGGGMGAGGIPLSEIFADGTGNAFEQVFAIVVPAVIIANIVAIILAAISNRMGEIRTSLSGDGVLLPEEKWMPEDGIETSETTVTEETVVMGWVIAVSLLVLGYLLANAIPIHQFAIMILATVALKLLKVFPEDVEHATGHFYEFIKVGFVGPLLLGVGLTLVDTQVLVETLSVEYFAIVSITIIGAALGAAAVGRLLDMYPIEAALCGGLCMANMGGTGDVATLAAAERMELMAFAQISSRLGGAMMLLIGEVAILVWGQHLVV